MTDALDGPLPGPEDLSQEIRLISDGDGLAVVGDSQLVERFLASEGLPSSNLEVPQVNAILNAVGVAARGASIAASASGRWVQLTDESAKAIQQWGLMQSSQTGLSMGIVQASGQAHGIKKIVQFASDPGSLSSMALNPLALSNVAALMQQLALQRAINEMKEYLATIDEKVDDVLRAQKDAVIADMIGVDLIVEEAMSVRDHVGGVSDVTWSKVQATSATIARTQAYALRQLDALAQKLESAAGVDEILKAAREAENKGQEWIAIIARCFQLQDSIAVLELDRVMATAPGDLDHHRQGLKVAREQRLATIAASTAQLLSRMNSAASRANAKVLFNPFDSPAVKDKALEVGARGLEAAGRFSAETVSRTTEPFRAVDSDGDGVPDKPRALVAAEDAGLSIKGAAASAAGAIGSALQRRRPRHVEVPEIEAD